MNVKKHARPISTSVFHFSNLHCLSHEEPTNRRKHQLIHRHPLQRRYRAALLGNRERTREKRKPVKLYRRHEEAVRHEARQTLKVKGRGTKVLFWKEMVVGLPFFFLVVELDGDEFGVLESGGEGGFFGSLVPEGGQGLGDCICYSSQDLGGFQSCCMR